MSHMVITYIVLVETYTYLIKRTKIIESLEHYV